MEIVRGSSPRVWGTPRRTYCGDGDGRFIPTGVGNTFLPPARTIARTVHPHGCGEHPTCSIASSLVNGSSPRVWGTQLREVTMPYRLRFIPTGVGNTNPTRRLRGLFSVHPHGCGEHPRQLPFGLPPGGSSPRVWGTQLMDVLNEVWPRFIPTGVGNTSPRPGIRSQPPVHPHGCGEHPASISSGSRYCGSSPRVWGTRLAAS